MFSRLMATLAALGSASRLVELQLRGDGDEGDDASAVPVDGAVFLQQLGVAARPLIEGARRTVRALAHFDGLEWLVLKVWDKARTPTDLAAGETRIYACGKLTVRVRCLADGTLAIESDGGDVTVNGGTLDVARVTDPVNIASISGTCPPGGGPVTFTVVALDANGFPAGVPAVGPSATLAGVIANSGGAQHFKA